MMLSAYMLPRNKNIRDNILNKMLEAKSSMHFIIENYIFDNKSDLNELDFLLNCDKLLNLCKIDNKYYTNYQNFIHNY